MRPPPGRPQDGRERQRGAEPRLQGSKLAATISILARPSQGRDPAMLGRMSRSSGSSLAGTVVRANALAIPRMAPGPP
jgi:hypothetical protein